jgi:hypothetical protein
MITLRIHMLKERSHMQPLVIYYGIPLSSFAIPCSTSLSQRRPMPLNANMRNIFHAHRIKSFNYATSYRCMEKAR